MTAYRRLVLALEGFGSLLDVFGGTEPEVVRAIRSRTVESALQDDWRAIGDDLRKTLLRFDAELQDPSVVETRG